MNLPRLPEATRHDAMTWLNKDGMPPRLRVFGQWFARHKVNIARRIAHRANDAMTMTAVVGDVADDKTAKLLTDCDFLFLAADTMLARDVINQIAYQFIIPTMQVTATAGSRRQSVLDSRLEARGGRILDKHRAQTAKLAGGAGESPTFPYPERHQGQALGLGVQPPHARRRVQSR
jgi:hypothetical protein